MNKTNQTIYRNAIAHPYTRASFRTLDKHNSANGIDETAALRLLRRNVRDVAPGASDETQDTIARQLLHHWRTCANVSRTHKE